MQPVDTIINARWVVPIIPENVVLESQSVVVSEGIIVDILPISEAREKYSSKNIIECMDHVVMPGLINMHTHAAMSLFKSFSDDKSLDDWLQKDIWPAEAKFVGDEFCRDGSKLACAEMLRSGTTCYNDMYFAIPEAIKTILPIGIRSCQGVGVFGFPTSWAPNAEECLAKNRVCFSEYVNKNDLITMAIAPHAPYTVQEEDIVKSKALANEFSETKNEMESSIRGEGPSHHLSAEHMTPIQNFARLDILANTICAHCVHVTEEDIALLAAHHAHVVHNPTSNLKLASGIAPVQKMLDAGVNVCLGTDSACSNNNLDMFSEMRNAALLGKVAACSATACSAATVLRMATLNGATALGLEKRIGSVEVGKEADLIAVDMNRVETWPLSNIISHLVYAVGRDQVTDVWVKGKQLMKERELLTIDMKELPALAEKWKHRLYDLQH